MTPEEVLAALWRLIAGPWIGLWRGLRTRWRRVAKVLIYLPMLLMATSSAALADSGAPSSLSWIRVTDSKGVEIWQYQISLDGGGVSDPGKLLWSSCVEFLWEIYRACVAFAAWLVDWTVSFEWLTWVTTPVTILGENLQNMVDRFGAAPTFLTLAALCAVVLMMRGRWATGAYDLMVSLIVASLATGILASPVQLVAGEGGLLFGARDFGVEFAEGLDPTAVKGSAEEEENPYGPNAVYARAMCAVSMGGGFDVDSTCKIRGKSYYRLFPLSKEGLGVSKQCLVYDSRALIANLPELTKPDIDEDTGVTDGHTHHHNTNPATFDSTGQLTKAGTIMDQGNKVVIAVGVRCPQTGDDIVNAKPAKMIVDTFLRQPHQLINFGRLLDGTKCEDDYQKVLEGGPYSGDDAEDIREEVGDCNKAAGETAENPNSSMALSVLVLLPAAFAVLGLVILLCGAVLIAGFYALYQALKMIVALVMALLPGGGRGALWMTFADLVVSLVMVVFSVCFLSAYMLLIQSMFTAGESNMKIFFIIDVLMIVGCAVYWNARGRIKAAADRLAAAMAKRPGSARPTSIPARGQLSPMAPAAAFYGARTAAGGAAALGRGYKRVSGRAADGITAGGRRLVSGAGKTKSRLDFAGTAAGRHSAGERLADRLKSEGDRTQRGLPRPVRPLALNRANEAPLRQDAAARRRHELRARLNPRALEARTAPRPGGPSGSNGPDPRGPGRGTGGAARMSDARPVAPKVVQGTVVATRPAADDPSARLRARMAELRGRSSAPAAIPLGSRKKPGPGQ